MAIRKGTRVKHHIVSWEGTVQATDRTAVQEKATVLWDSGRKSVLPLTSLEKISRKALDKPSDEA